MELVQSCLGLPLLESVLHVKTIFSSACEKTSALLLRETEMLVARHSSGVSKDGNIEAGDFFAPQPHNRTFVFSVSLYF